MLYRTLRDLKRGLGLSFYKDDDDLGGGGGGGGAKPNPDPNKDKGGGGDDPAAELARLRAENAALKAAKDGGGKDDDDSSLQDKARKEREAREAGSARDKRLTAAIAFDLKSKEFLRTNESLLPKEAGDIFAQAEKENFSDAIEKDAAIKAGVVQSFFAVQSNVDLLTPALKAQLDEYLKLTKTGKQDRAQQVYDTLFEPTLEALRRSRKAEALSKGHGAGDDDSYKQRLIAGSRKQYLRETV